MSVSVRLQRKCRVLVGVAFCSVQIACIEQDPDWLGRPDDSADGNTASDDAGTSDSETEDEGSSGESSNTDDQATDSGTGDIGSTDEGTGTTGDPGSGTESDSGSSGTETDDSGGGDGGNSSDGGNDEDTDSDSSDSSGGSDDGESGTGDSGTDTDTDPPLTCTQAWSLPGLTLESPEEVTEINSTAYESGIALSPDGLTIYFARYPTGNGDMFQASRPSLTDPFGTVTAMDQVNTSAAEWNYVLSADLLSAFIVSDRSGGEGQTDIWMAQRTDPGGPFGAFGLVSEISTSGEEWDVHLSSDARRIYWTNGSGDADNLHFATRASTQESFGAPQSLGIGTASTYEDSPVLTADGLVLLFGTDETGGPGGRDLWYAVRDDLDGAFGAPQVLPIVNSSGREGELALSPDDCELYFNSDRPGGTGNWDVYRTRIVLP